jgi:hypothetical protein
MRKHWRNWLIGPILGVGTSLVIWGPKHYRFHLRHQMTRFGVKNLQDYLVPLRHCSTQSDISNGAKITSIGIHIHKLCLSQVYHHHTEWISHQIPIVTHVGLVTFGLSRRF